MVSRDYRIAICIMTWLNSSIANLILQSIVVICIKGVDFPIVALYQGFPLILVDILKVS